MFVITWCIVIVNKFKLLDKNLSSKENGMFRIKLEELQERAYRIRRYLIDLMYRSGSGHLDTSLSLVEVWLSLVNADFFQFDPHNGSWEGRDRVFLSEGHACPLQYLINADLGYYTFEDVFEGFRKPHTPFQGHTQRSLAHGFENSNGSLGISLWQAYGHALATDRLVFCIAGDGEFEEPISQGLLSAPLHLRQAPNFTLIINNNKLAQDAAVDIGPIGEVAQLYGWQVLWVDGHDFTALYKAYREAVDDWEHSSLLICETVKGMGGDPANEGKLGFHGRPPQSEEEYKAYIAGLEATRRS